MKFYGVWIKGVTSLLQHRFSEDAQVASGGGTRKVQAQRELPRDVAEKSAYREPTGELYFPGAAIGRLMREAGSSHKQRGTRKSVKFIVPAATLVMDDVLPLFDAPHGTRLVDFEVDSRPVVIPSTKGRIMCHRPRLDAWAAAFRIRINDTIMTTDLVHQLLVDGGQQIGIGDFRPEKGGPFGTFSVVEWTEIEI